MPAGVVDRDSDELILAALELRQLGHEWGAIGLELGLEASSIRGMCNRVKRADIKACPDECPDFIAQHYEAPN